MNVELIRNVVGNGIQSSPPTPAHLVILVMLLLGPQPLGYPQCAPTPVFSELFTFAVMLLALPMHWGPHRKQLVLGAGSSPSPPGTGEFRRESSKVGALEAKDE